VSKTLITRKKLCERWGLSYNTICNYELNGTLTRNPNFESPMYYMEEIIKIESLNEPNPLSPMERIKKDKRIEELEKKVNFYEEKIKIFRSMLTEI
jgi:hypothetical protein